MDITLLSHSINYYTTRRLVEAAHALGHRAAILDPVSASLHVRNGAVEVHADGIAIRVPELVIPRIGSTLTRWSLRLLDALTTMGARSAISTDAIRTCCDKMETHLRLVEAGIPSVPSALIRDVDQIDWVLEQVGGTPIVAKQIGGTQGREVFSAPTRGNASELLEKMLTKHEAVLVQPQVPMERPRDLRVIIAGGEAIAAYYRHAPTGDFRSNIHCGGQVEAVKITPDIQQLALNTAQAVGAWICGVDLLPYEDRFLVLEVNASPGLEGIETATGEKLAERILKAALTR